MTSLLEFKRDEEEVARISVDCDNSKDESAYTVIKYVPASVLRYRDGIIKYSFPAFKNNSNWVVPKLYATCLTS
jgi:hypothetical protein